MNSRLRKSSVFVPSMIAALALISGAGMVQGGQTGLGPGPGMGGRMAQPQRPGCAMHGQRKHRMGMMGDGYRTHGKHQGKHKNARCAQHLFGGYWSQSLSHQQKVRLDQLHVNHAKIKAPLKARIKALKVDLAVLAMAPEPDKAVIDAKIEEMLKLKGQVLGAKYGYIAAQRRVLTPVQQVGFDMEQIHGAMHGKKGKGGQRAGH